MVDSSGDVGLYSSLTIGTDGLPLVSYYDWSGGWGVDGDLKAAHCGNAFCVPYFRRR